MLNYNYNLKLKNLISHILSTQQTRLFLNDKKMLNDSCKLKLKNLISQILSTHPIPLFLGAAYTDTMKQRFFIWICLNKVIFFAAASALGLSFLFVWFIGAYLPFSSSPQAVSNVVQLAGELQLRYENIKVVNFFDKPFVFNSCNHAFLFTQEMVEGLKLPNYLTCRQSRLLKPEFLMFNSVVCIFKTDNLIPLDFIYNLNSISPLQYIIEPPKKSFVSITDIAGFNILNNSDLCSSVVSVSNIDAAGCIKKVNSEFFKVNPAGISLLTHVKLISLSQIDLGIFQGFTIDNLLRENNWKFHTGLYFGEWESDFYSNSNQNAINRGREISFSWLDLPTATPRTHTVPPAPVFPV